MVTSLEMIHNFVASQRFFVFYIRHFFFLSLHLGADHHVVQLYMCASVCFAVLRRPEECETNENQKKKRIKPRQNTVVVSCFLWSGIP